MRDSQAQPDNPREVLRQPCLTHAAAAFDFMFTPPSQLHLLTFHQRDHHPATLTPLLPCLRREPPEGTGRAGSTAGATGAQPPRSLRLASASAPPLPGASVWGGGGRWHPGRAGRVWGVPVPAGRPGVQPTSITPGLLP